MRRPVEISVEAPWDFEGPDGPGKILANAVGIVTGPYTQSSKGEYLLLRIETPFKINEELVTDLVACPRYNSETPNQMIVGECWATIARVLKGKTIQVGDHFEARYVETCFLGTLTPISIADQILFKTTRKKKWQEKWQSFYNGLDALFGLKPEQRNPILGTYTVAVKKTASILFPERCICCGSPCADESTEYSGSIDDKDFFSRYKNTFKSNPKLRVPAHQSCIAVLKKKSRIRGTISGLIFVLGLVVVYLLYETFDDWLLLLALLPVLLINRLIFDPYWYYEPFSFSVNNIRYRFEFINKEYSREFRQLNEQHLHEERLFKHFGT